ncbi:FK506-binding protein 5-like [Helianthus annuus]|uniref:FK506-binding protein 5-like n=1 Tax=Helianthus annuus TaxID=4232 RepID=UPI000B8F3537|nr:FK506-binding protein 5-like [Helianthus annuus]
MLLVDEPEVEEPTVNVEDNPYAGIEEVMLDLVDLEAEQAVNVEAQKEKVIDDIEDEVDETERLKRIQAETEKEKLLRKRKRQEKEDAPNVPSPQHVYDSQSPSSGRKKAGARKKVVGFPAVPSNLNVSLDDVGDFDFANTAQVKNVEKKVDEVIAENKRLAAENKKVSDREKILEMHVKRLETDNKELLKKIDTDQSKIDILKVRVAELEEEKARRDEQNKYFELKNKELEAEKAFKEHEFYMLNKVVEKMLGKSIEQQFEEIQVEKLRAKRQAEIDEQMKIKGDDEEDDEDEKVFSASSHGSDNDDDDAQDETGGAEGKGESGDAQNVKHVEKLILRLDTYREEGEQFHTYTLETIKEMTRMVNPDFKFDFEEELNAFDINYQPEYEYKYVEDADMYDRVEVEDWTDDESENEDTSQCLR